MTLLSIVVPCYNESKCLAIFVKVIEDLNPNDGRYEIVFVDDGSDDETLDLIKETANDDKRIHYVSFSRNFGKSRRFWQD